MMNKHGETSLVIPFEEKPTECELVESEGVSSADVPEDKHADEDYELSRDTIRDLLNTSSKAIEDLVELTRVTDSPKAFEILNSMISTSATVADRLMDLHRRRQDIKKTLKNSPTSNNVNNPSTTNNNLFVGTTADFFKMIEEAKKNGNTK